MCENCLLFVFMSTGNTPSVIVYMCMCVYPFLISESVYIHSTCVTRKLNNHDFNLVCPISSNWTSRFLYMYYTILCLCIFHALTLTIRIIESTVILMPSFTVHCN